MGTGVPLLNEYKLEFFTKRLPQTILGGLKLRIGYEAPVYVYINQVLLFAVPVLLGGIFTLLVQLNTIKDYIAVYTFGALMTAYVLLVQLISHIIQVNLLLLNNRISFNLKKKLLLIYMSLRFICKIAK